MKRARATRLALVNWKGLVYEELELDQGVTALEGENGAGKTTVMIAAYTVLLPDLSYLRFTNVGETGSTGGDAGIYGRLGHAGPAYAWLDLELGRKRVVAGVLLDRKARPRLEVSPYLLDDVPPEVPLETLVMRRHGGQVEVPEPPDIANLALAAGARPRVFGRDKKGYFSALFELGLTPLRMATGEERKKLDDMLRTCMMGGISNVLRTGLRDFLFAENTRLADTVKRMEHNLALCRDTRARVRRSEELQREIGELYEKGESTFLYAAHGVAVWEREARARVAELRGEEASLQKEATGVADALAGAEAELDAGQREEEAYTDRLDLAEQRVRQVETALDLLDKVRSKRRDVADMEVALETEKEGLSTAIEQLTQAESDEENARDEATTAARNLSSHQEAYQDLSRRAGLHRTALGRLETAREALGLHALETGELSSRLKDAEERETGLRDRFRTIELRLEDAEGHATRHAEGLGLLARLLGREAHPGDLGAAGELRERLQDASRQLPKLEQEATEAARLAGLQRDARHEAKSLGVLDATGLDGEISEGEVSEQRLGSELDANTAERAEVELALAQDGQALDGLREELPGWLGVRDALASVVDRVGAIVSSDDLARARASLGDAIEEQRQSHSEQQQVVVDLTERIRALELQADHPEHVVRARDVVDGEIVAEHFDEVALDRAATVQAWLGPRAHALLVESPRRAAARLAEEGALGPGQDVLLVRGLPSLPDEVSTTETGTVLVPSGQELRVAQPPVVPVLGRAARARALSGLRAELETAEASEEGLGADLDRLTADHGVLEAALPLAAALDRPDPRPVIATLETRMRDASLRRDALVDEAKRLRGELDAVRRRLRLLRALLPKRDLLDPPDRTAQARAAQARHGIALTDARRWETTRADWQRLGELREDLRRSPLTAAGLEDQRTVLQELGEARARLRDATEAMRELIRDPAPLGWSDSEALLAETAALAPALEAAHDLAKQALALTVTAMKDARAARDAVQKQHDDARVARDLAVSGLEDLQERLHETGLPTPKPSMLTEARQARDDLKARRTTLKRRLSELQEAIGGLKKDRDQTRAALEKNQERLAQAEGEHSNRVSTWEGFAEAARAAGLRVDALLRRPVEVEGSPNLFSEAKARCAAITTLLRRSGPDDILALYEGIGDGTRVQHVLAWAALRSELHRRIPPDISEAPDVVDRLEDLGRRLHRLRQTLQERERDLRTDARHIGTTIKSQRRRAYSLVRNLAKSLEEVSFGTIARITLSHEAVRKMDELLDALSGQVDLFSQPRPVEEVMVELFESIGGGRVRAARLLDYRQYFHVRVEAVRDDGSRVGARGDQMSTGEAIGIGAAVMMVVLQAWEQHSAKLRKKQQHGTMRLLFLDEATRLSPKSLTVLFDLCHKLDLQLLIAAPEVARVAGGTTYTLVRHKDRVDFHGRRVVRHGLGE